MQRERNQAQPCPAGTQASLISILLLLGYVTVVAVYRSPKDVQVLIPRTCEYGILHGKGELRPQMELTLLISQL